MLEYRTRLGSTKGDVFAPSQALRGGARRAVPSGILRSDLKNGLLLPDMRVPSLKQFWLDKRCSSYQKKRLGLRNKKIWGEIKCR